MPKLTFYPLGNADCCKIDLADGRMLLFDYANRPALAAASDRRIDLAAALHEDLAEIGRDFFDVVAFTHADEDHARRMSEFFWMEHATRYQGAGRIRINELWVPAAVIVETNLPSADAHILQAEARYRLRTGSGIRVFSRPERLAAWLAAEGIPLTSVAHLITDAGQLVPGFSKLVHGVEFFVHSPFAERVDDQVIDRNSCSLVLQATFSVDGRDTRLMLSADTPWEDLAALIRVTEYHGRYDRLVWDIFKLPHHCSYRSLSPDKGTEETVPDPMVAKLFQQYSTPRCIIVSMSDPIPAIDTDQPPHRQAANFYKRRVIAPKSGEFKVTMEHPRADRPERLVIWIDGGGARVEKRNQPGASAILRRPVRAG
jgi:hypothetical protein